MKKKLLISLFILFGISYFNMSRVYANSMNITCDKTTIDVGETTSCKVIGTATETIAGISAGLGSDSHIEILTDTIRNLSTFSGDYHIYYGTGIQSPGTFDIASFDIKGLSSGRGAITLREYSDQSPLGFLNEDSTLYIGVPDVNYYITVGNGTDPTPKSSDSSLAALVPSVGELTPPFASNVYNYGMDIDFTNVRRIDFTATKNHPLASVSGTTCTIPNSKNIKNTTCNITVTAEDGSKSTYAVTVNNSAYEEEVIPAEITKITTNDGLLTPTFSKDVLNYTMNINFLNFDNVSFKITFSDGNSSTQKCDIPKSSSVESVTCTIDKYTILIKNTNSPDIKCDLVIKSNVYTIDQAKKIIKVNSEHSLETIKSNLYSSCGEIRVFNDKVTISDNSNIVEYKLEKLIMPQTGNNLIIYPLAIASVLVIIGLFIFIKKKYFKKEI